MVSNCDKGSVVVYLWGLYVAPMAPLKVDLHEQQTPQAIRDVSTTE